MNAYQVSGGSTGKGRYLGSTAVARGLVRAAVLAALGLGALAPAHAAVFWLDDDPMRPRYMDVPPAPSPSAPPRQDRLKRQGAKLEKQAKEHAKPVGPLVIAISIDNQTMRVFDANGLFAETRVSTGMRGHATPMGVFSIIQKNKWHKSNIYSGAPMPYMQRITWSGIALHAGVVPGYPASHGCIRLPMAFATKLWGWTRMGARVIITPGEISPSDIAHPQLLAQKPAPVASAPMAAPKLDAAPKSADGKPADLGLKLGDGVRKTVTADAAAALGAPVMSDAVAKPELPVAIIAAANAADSKADGRKADDNKASGESRVTRRDVDDAAANAIALSGTATAPATSADLPPASPATTKPAQTTRDEPRAADAPAAAAKPDLAKRDAVDVPPPPDLSPKRSGQIAVLISGKDGKLYVRQNFTPLFETPIAIKPSDRPLGTHVFTARVDKDEARSVHWTAVTLPSHHVIPDDAAPRRRKPAADAIAPPLVDSAAEALDRVTIPPEAMSEIAEALATGGSITVSDLSIKAGGETGQGTEFVVPLR